jgi:hypothetical protein
MERAKLDAGELSQLHTGDQRAPIPKSNSPGRGRGCINYREKALALALLATALLSGFLLPGLLALLAGLLLAALLLAGLLLAALLLLTRLVLAALLATLIGIVHDHSCVRLLPTPP